MNDFSKPRTEFADIDGDTMQVGHSAEQDHFLITMDGPYLTLHATQAPAVALAILTAAGFVPRGNRRDSDSLQESVDTAAGYLDDAVHLAAGAAAAKVLSKRRDELAKALFDLPVYSLHPGPFTYVECTEVVRAAIDMIIQLQDEATK